MPRSSSPEKVRRWCSGELLVSSRPVGEHFYIPVVNNCSRGAGVAIDPEGPLSFMVTGYEGFAGDSFPIYFSARQAARHALLRQTGASEAAESAPGVALPSRRPKTRVLAHRGRTYNNLGVEK